MATTVLKKRKIIDLPEDAFRSLSVKAAARGKNLKVFIEELLINEAKAEPTDEELYRFMLNTHPEGKESLSNEETGEFEKWLGV